MSLYVLGVDGGGTKTNAAILDEHSHLCGFGRGGPSNLDDLSLDVIQANISNAIHQACQMAGLASACFDSAFFGMAGVVSPRDRHAIQKIAEAMHLAPPEHIGIDHDCRIALAGGLRGRPGIVLIAGTGSSCFGMNAERESWRAGGWAHLLADEGSGYWLGLHAMKIAVASYDGRAKPSVLMELVKRHLGLTDMNEIMHRLYVVGLSRAEMAALAPIVLDAAAAGDAAAINLIQRGTQELADYVLAVAQHLSLASGNPEIVLVGGLFHSGEIFLQPTHQAILQRLPGCRIQQPEFPPVVGACILGLQALSLSMDDEQAHSLHKQVEKLGIS
jgi:N-acetylglucosamine kinase-like BadF-type ATPase